MNMLSVFIFMLSFAVYSQTRIVDVISDLPQEVYIELEEEAIKQNVNFGNVLDSEISFYDNKVEIKTDRPTAFTYYVGISLGAVYHANLNTGANYNNREGKKNLNLEVAVRALNGFSKFEASQLQLSLSKYFGKKRSFSAGLHVNKVQFARNIGFGPIVGYERGLFKDKVSVRSRFGLDYHYSSGGINYEPGFVSDFILEVGLKINLSNIFKRKDK